MSLETVTLSEELEKIEVAKNEIRESAKRLREFILSAEFLEDYVGFEKLLGDFQDKVVTLVELTTTPQPAIAMLEALQQQQKQAPMEKGELQTTLAPYVTETFTLPKAVVSLSAIVGTTIIVQNGLLPPIAVLGVVGAVLAFAFAPQLKTLIESFFKKEEKKEEEITPEKLEDWVNESIAKIRSVYMSARFLLKVQKVSDDIIQRFKELGMDEALVDREHYFKETLPHEFLSRIGRIMVACDRSIWYRKQLIVSAMVQASQAQMLMRGAG